MLTLIAVNDFRGIKRLRVEGLSRVNLIIGKNDSGKTALMEALELAWAPDDAGLVLVARQAGRYEGADIRDFDDFWRPIFHLMEAERGFHIAATNEHGEKVRLSFKKASFSPPAISADIGDSLATTGPWALEYEVARPQVTPRIIRGGPEGVQFPPKTIASEGRMWISAGPGISPNDIRALSKLKQRGHDDAVTGLLRRINERIRGVELLAPTGQRVMVFIRLEHEGLLPLQMMGEGVKRCFELAVALSSDTHPLLCIDEIENGLHHSALEPLWSWVAQASASKNAQVFATTHSEECVQAACRAFKELNDEGLRVIRLDKQEQETKAVVYDRDLVEAAERMGVEIRG